MKLRDSIRLAVDHKVKTVNVPEWGVDVHFRTMTFAEAIQYERGLEKYPDGRASALYLTYTLCDENGDRIYTHTDEDVQELCQRNTAIVSRLFYEARSFNGHGDSHEDLAKN